MVMTLPKCVYLKPAVDLTVKAVNENERTVESIITTDRVDSDQEVVITKGLSFERHDKNPVVLFMHEPTSVIGKCNERRTRKGQAVATTQFAETDLAEEVFQLYAQGFMKGWSIGMDYMTIKRRDITPDDVRKRADWAGARTVIEKADVMEYSAVSIPANPDALSKAFKGGMIKHCKSYFQDAVPVEVAPVEVKNVTPVRETITVRPVRMSAADIAEYAADETRRVLRLIRGID